MWKSHSNTKPKIIFVTKSFLLPSSQRKAQGKYRLFFVTKSPIIFVTIKPKESPLSQIQNHQLFFVKIQRKVQGKYKGKIIFVTIKPKESPLSQIQRKDYFLLKYWLFFDTKERLFFDTKCQAKYKGKSWENVKPIPSQIQRKVLGKYKDYFVKISSQIPIIFCTKINIKPNTNYFC